jgi:hypothetical protein
MSLRRVLSLGKGRGALLPCLGLHVQLLQAVTQMSLTDNHIFQSTVVCQNERAMHISAARNVTGCESDTACIMMYSCIQQTWSPENAQLKVKVWNKEMVLPLSFSARVFHLPRSSSRLSVCPPFDCISKKPRLPLFNEVMGFGEVKAM